MKNTMKIKSLLSFFVPAALMALSVASCSDYDNGYNEAAIKFTEQFKKTFGDIDPEQDWNLAERATVTVSTMTESEVKIYAKVGNEYTLVGDYVGVNGTRMLGFDIVEGTTEIMVSDGKTAVKTTPNGTAVFGMSTKAIVYEGERDGVNVTELKSNVTIQGTTYQPSRVPTDSEIATTLEKIPETVNNIGKTGIYSDFTYVSTGSFIIYPYYWNTSSINTIGVYYTDETGYHEVDIYTSNGELAYVEGYGETFLYNDKENQNPNDNNNPYWRPNDWGISASPSVPIGNFHKNGWSRENDESELKTPFIEYWKNKTSLGSATITKNIWQTFTPNHDYLVLVKARLMSEDSACDGETGTVTFTANSSSVKMTDDVNCTRTKYNGHDVVYSDIDGTKMMWVKCKSDNDGKIKVSFTLDNIKSNWFAFNGLKIYDAEHFDANYLIGRNDNFYNSSDRGKGIQVDIPENVKFGMYLKKTDSSGSWKFYSESMKNKEDERLRNTYCYCSTFEIGDQMFIGLEDWPNGDCDLNDLVFAFDGCKPTIINEDPEKGGSWLLACEDLGGSFDIDYNDVVFKVQHISGRTSAFLTPLAAGGALASYIYYQDPFNVTSRDKCFGEIHQLLGASQGNSGKFKIINALSRYERTATDIEFAVDEDWTMAYYSTGETGGDDYGSDVNMGGFQIRTLNMGKNAPFTLNINSTDFSGASVIQPAIRDRSDNVPYILCIPYPYTKYNMNRTREESGKKTEYVWAWPVEYMTICDENGVGPYPDFKGWVENHNNNIDWYKNKDYVNSSSATVEDEMFVSDMTSQEKRDYPSGGGTTKWNSPLGNKGSITITLGEGVNLYDNLTNQTSSYGTLTFVVGYGGNNYSSGQYGFNMYYFVPNTEGVHTITFTQAEDGNYKEGTTTFILTVNPKSTVDQESDFAVRVSTVPRGNTSATGWDDANNHTVYIPEGVTFSLTPHHDNTPGTVTVKEFNNGGTGTTCSVGVTSEVTGDVTITPVANASGTASLTLHYSGGTKDGTNYTAKDVTYTFKIASTIRCQIKVASSTQNLSNVDGYSGSPNGWWLNKQSDADKLLLNQYYGQPWILEQVPDETGYYYLYNVNNSTYLRLGDVNTYDPTISSQLNPGDKGKFLIENVSDGVNLKCKASNYVGNDADGHVYLNKWNYVTWELVYSSSAKRRNAPAKKR